MALTSSTSVNQVMTTAIVSALDHRRQPHRCRLLLDTAASANFITEGLVNVLRLRANPSSVPVGALNGLATQATSKVTVTIQSTDGNYRKTYNFYTIPQIADRVPGQPIPRQALEIPGNLPLADPEFYKPAPVDMLLGSGPTLALLCVGQYDLSHPGEPDLRLQKTLLNWVLGGTVQIPKRHRSHQTCLTATVDFDLEKFWSLEEGPKIRRQSPEEQQVVTHFKRTHHRDASGRYVVALPFNKGLAQLGNSKDRAIKRFLALERKWERDAEFEQQYRAAMGEYLTNGYMTQVEDADDRGFYLPHHAVIKQDSAKTKVRVVFDGSAKSSTGVSLNETLMAGPTLQDDIFCLILRFRLPRYVLTGDIEKMFLQFQVRKEDRKYQRLIWRDNEGHIATYELNTVTFGLTSSPYQAVQCLWQLTEDEAHRHPDAAEIIKRDMYVDDHLTGFQTISEGVTARHKMTEILQAGQLKMRHWASNDRRLLQGLPEDSINQRMQFSDDKTLKTLGVFWNAQSDTIVYTVRAIPRAKRVTKRFVLSEVAKIFDPLGLLGPIILAAKMLIQRLWQLKLGWDESVPTDLHTEWSEYCTQLSAINEMVFPRWISLKGARSIQLHGFCDASMTGFGACLYFRTTNQEGEVRTELICAKSRVAPLKTVSLPRLELCGALLLAKLQQVVRHNMPDPDLKTYLWSDSMVALHWINTSAHLLKTFVANRVAEIQTTSTQTNWRHVPGEQNPADALSRGQFPADFTRNTLWREGPGWLKETEDAWPDNPVVPPKADPEGKGATCLVITTQDTSILERYSSLSKLRRIIAYCLRFKGTTEATRHLTVQELDNAERVIVRMVQRSAFTRELHDLTHKGSTDNRSKLLPLNPFIDKDGVIRVGGRLKHSALPFSQRHPIVMPKGNPVTRLLIDSEHKAQAHAGTLGTLYSLRRRYWVLDGRNEVRGIIRRCTTCLAVKPPSINYIMGDLPQARVTMTRPFLNVGVDYCGPFYIKEKKFRNRGQIKTYVAVFICLVTKAVHLELVSDMTSAGFIAALRRFIGRRGKCLQIQSDNGTNFVGANNELKDIITNLQMKENERHIASHLGEQGIKWRFIPPASPHFGGIWEAAVKSFKHHLKRVAGRQLFTFEEFNTLLIEIEAILNSRPLTPISSDPNDLLVLTPGHFLIGDSLTSLPERDFIDVPDNRLSNWQHIQKVRQDFWARWYKEYLNELNVRRKWKSGQPNVEVGTIVLLKEDNLPPMQWKLGRVVDVQPGTDGVVRVVKVKTQGGMQMRNVKRIAPLPITNKDSQ